MARYGQELIEDKQGFRNEIMMILSKLNNPDSVKVAEREMKAFVVHQVKDGERLQILINCIAENNVFQKVNVRKDQIKLFIIIAEVFQHQIVEYQPKIFAILNKKIKDSDPDMFSALADTYSGLIEFSLKNVSHNEATFIISECLKVLFDVVRTGNNNSQSGASICISKIIQNSPINSVNSLFEGTLNKIFENLKLEQCKCQGEMLECMLSLLLTNQMKVSKYIDLILPILLNNMHSQKWNVRKVSIDTLYSLCIICPNDIKEYKLELIEAINILKTDKNKNVREAAMAALNALKELPGEEPPKSNKRPESIQREIKSASTKKKAAENDSNNPYNNYVVNSTGINIIMPNDTTPSQEIPALNQQTPVQTITQYSMAHQGSGANPFMNEIQNNNQAPPNVQVNNSNSRSGSTKVKAKKESRAEQAILKVKMKGEARRTTVDAKEDKKAKKIYGINRGNINPAFQKKGDEPEEQDEEHTPEIEIFVNHNLPQATQEDNTKHEIQNKENIPSHGPNDTSPSKSYQNLIDADRDDYNETFKNETGLMDQTMKPPPTKPTVNETFGEFSHSNSRTPYDHEKEHRVLRPNDDFNNNQFKMSNEKVQEMMNQVENNKSDHYQHRSERTGNNYRNHEIYRERSHSGRKITTNVETNLTEDFDRHVENRLVDETSRNNRVNANSRDYDRQRDSQKDRRRIDDDYFRVDDLRNTNHYRTLNDTKSDVEDMSKQIQTLKKDNENITTKYDSQQKLISSLQSQNNEMKVQINYLVGKMNYIEPYLYQINNNLRQMQSNIMPQQVMGNMPYQQNQAGLQSMVPNNQVGVNMYNQPGFNGSFMGINNMQNSNPPMIPVISKDSQNVGNSLVNSGNENPGKERSSKWNSRKAASGKEENQEKRYSVKNQGRSNSKSQAKYEPEGCTDNITEDDQKNSDNSHTELEDEEIYIKNRKITKPPAYSNIAKAKKIAEPEMEYEEDGDFPYNPQTKSKRRSENDEYRVNKRENIRQDYQENDELENNYMREEKKSSKKRGQYDTEEANEDFVEEQKNDTQDDDINTDLSMIDMDINEIVCVLIKKNDNSQIQDYLSNYDVLKQFGQVSERNCRLLLKKIIEIMSEGPDNCEICILWIERYIDHRKINNVEYAQKICHLISKIMGDKFVRVKRELKFLIEELSN